MKPIKPRQVLNNGEKVWCVDLRSMGGGRTFFQDEDDAKDEAVSWEKERRVFGAAAFDLDHDERSRFMAARARLNEVDATIEDAVELFLRIGPVKEHRSLADAVKAIIKNRRSAGKRDRYIVQLQSSLNIFTRGREDMPCSDVTQPMVEEWLNGHEWAIKTRRGKLVDVRTLFSYAMDQGWCNSNPCPNPKDLTVDDKPPGILTVKQVQALLDAAIEHEPSMVPYLSIGLFCGIRPEELAKLDASDVDMRSKHVEVPATKSKTRKRRLVDMPANLKAWLKAAKGHPIAPVNLKRKFDRVRKLAKLKAWPHDAMRHSFASYHLSAHGSQDKTATQMGHRDSGMLYAHYRQIVAKADARKYWRITPPENK